MRLFIAVPLPDALKQEMLTLSRDIVDEDRAVRWSRADQLHLTLKFLGETARDLVGRITDAMRQAVVGVSPFELIIEGTGCFPPGGPVRIVWIGGQDPSGSLSKVVQRLEPNLADLGFKKETRTFSIHFTIGRVKFDRSRGKLRDAVSAAGFASRRLNVDRIVLYNSDLTPKGAKYTALETVTMDGRTDL